MLLKGLDFGWSHSTGPFPKPSPYTHTLLPVAASTSLWVASSQAQCNQTKVGEKVLALATVLYSLSTSQKYTEDNFYCIFYFLPCVLRCWRCMDGQCNPQTWQAGGKTTPEGTGACSLTVIPKKREEGEADPSGVQLLSTRARRERKPTQLGMLSWPSLLPDMGDSRHGYVSKGLPFPRAAFSLFMGNAKT